MGFILFCYFFHDFHSLHWIIHLKGMKNLLKWKGIMFGIDDADKTTTQDNVQTPVNSEATTTTSSELDSSCATMIEINSIILDNGKSVVESNEQLIRDMRHQVNNIRHHTKNATKEYTCICSALQFFWWIPPAHELFTYTFANKKFP